MMIMNDLVGGRQCESNVPDCQIDGKLQKPQSAETARTAKAERIPYSGVQRKARKANPYVQNGPEVIMDLGAGKSVILDAADYPLVADYRWKAESGGDVGGQLFYATSGIRHLAHARPHHGVHGRPQERRRAR